jgi:hypothetical protein
MAIRSFKNVATEDVNYGRISKASLRINPAPMIFDKKSLDTAGRAKSWRSQVLPPKTHKPSLIITKILNTLSFQATGAGFIFL